MEIISFIGIVAALILIILGSVRGYSLILLSTVAALLVAATGGVNVFENYANVYMGGVANMVLALFPIFLGGQMFGKMLEMSGLPMAVASGVFRKLGPASAVAAVYLATLAMSVGGIDVFVIIFTMYPLAAAFFKAAGISRSLIPACVLGGAVAMQTLPGMPINNIVLPPMPSAPLPWPVSGWLSPALPSWAAATCGISTGQDRSTSPKGKALSPVKATPTTWI